MTSPKPIRDLQRRFLDRLTADPSSVIPRILDDLGVSRREFARWRRNLAFHARFHGCLGEQRKLARLEELRARKTVTKKVESKPVAPEPKRKSPRRKAARGVVPDHAVESQRDQSDGLVPYLTQDEITRALKAMVSDRTKAG